MTVRFGRVRKRLWEIDPLARSRTSLTNKCNKELVPSCEALVKHGHLQRAGELLLGIEPLTAGPERDLVRSLIKKVQDATSEVDLDEAGSGTLKGVSQKRSIVSDHYRLEANLEANVAQLVADTMDDIFGSYVRLYLDGDESRLTGGKVTIRIHENWTKMTDEWPGGERPSGLGGWWEPGAQKVTCYDTRTDSGTLDDMLGTLFHEASHQFMSMLAARGGGWAPAWLNEGTASFFEGAKAMADRRVLWPDAARGRLESLFEILTRGLLKAEDVIGFSDPGSYPGIMYPYGWGLVYFLQEFEDPDSLEYVWRPYYSEYRERITTTRPAVNSLELFEEVFLAAGNPGGFSSLRDFEQGFRDWIVDEIRPLHFGAARRERREARIERYLALADSAGTPRPFATACSLSPAPSIGEHSVPTFP